MVKLIQETISLVTHETTAMLDDEVNELCKMVTDWDVVVRNEKTHLLHRTFEFSGFDHALAFATAMGEIGVDEGQTPKMIIDKGNVTIEWETNLIEGFHRNDFIMAAKTDDIYANWELLTGTRDKVEQASRESFPASDPPGY